MTEYDPRSWDEQLLDEWASCMEEENLSGKTIRSRCGAVRSLLAAAGVVSTDLSAELVAAWLAGFGNLPTAVNYGQYVQSYTRWLTATGRLRQDPLAYADFHGRRRGPSRLVPAWRGPDELESLLSSWSVWMKAAGWSEKTVKLRLQVVRQYWKATGEPPLAFTAEGLSAWLAPIENRNTKAAYARSLRSYCQWLEEYGHRDDDPMRRLRQPKAPRRVPHPISTAALQRLFATVDGSTRVMLLLATYAGLRVHEIAKLAGEDIDLDEQVIRVVGKGGVDARLPLHPEIAAAAVVMPRRGYWFPSPTRAGRPITPGAVTARFREAMRAADIHGFRAHSLRHWYATTLLRCGADARTVQSLMRHSSLLATEGYLQLLDEGRREAVLRLPTVSASEPAPSARGTAREVSAWGESLDAPGWHHRTVRLDGAVYCAVCGELGLGQFYDDPTEGRARCQMWIDPAPSPLERQALGCPPWCDPHLHEREDDGSFAGPPQFHAGSLTTWTGLQRNHDGPVLVTLLTGDDIIELSPEEARQMAAQLLDGADTAEGV